MSNSDMLYSRAREFQDRRKAVMDTYEKRVTELKDAQGSRYHDEEMEKAEAERSTALSALKKEYGGYFNSILDSMEKTNSKRGMAAPTEEELRLVQLLKLKDNVSQAELESAAISLRGNATCLALLTDIARKQGYARSYDSYAENREMTVGAASDCISGIRSGLRDFMEHDTTRTSRHAANYYAALNRTDGNSQTLQKRPLFDTKAGCFYELSRIDGDEFTAFCKAVDGE